MILIDTMYVYVYIYVYIYICIYICIYIYVYIYMYIYICIYILQMHIFHHHPAAFAQLLRDHGGGGPSNFFPWSHRVPEKVGTVSGYHLQNW